MKNKRVLMLFVSLFAMAPAVFGASVGENRYALAYSGEAKECDLRAAKRKAQEQKLESVAEKKKPSGNGQVAN
jgi:hypothetical protein